MGPVYLTEIIRGDRGSVEGVDYEARCADVNYSARRVTGGFNSFLKRDRKLLCHVLMHPLHLTVVCGKQILLRVELDVEIQAVGSVNGAHILNDFGGSVFTGEAVLHICDLLNVRWRVVAKSQSGNSGFTVKDGVLSDAHVTVFSLSFSMGHADGELRGDLHPIQAGDGG